MEHYSILIVDACSIPGNISENAILLNQPTATSALKRAQVISQLVVTPKNKRQRISSNDIEEVLSDSNLTGDSSFFEGLTRAVSLKSENKILQISVSSEEQSEPLIQPKNSSNSINKTF